MQRGLLSGWGSVVVTEDKIAQEIFDMVIGVCHCKLNYIAKIVCGKQLVAAIMDER